MNEQIENMLVEWNKLNLSDRYIFAKTVQLQDGRNFQFGQSTGTKLGTSATQKIGFFGNTPVVKQPAITPPTGGTTVDSQARAAIDLLITTIQTFGLTS